MKAYELAWWLVISGAIYETLVAVSTADANVSGVTVDQTAFGRIYAPLEKINPFPVDIGTIALVGGAFVLAANWLDHHS